jgi:hypothetical protein
MTLTAGSGSLALYGKSVDLGKQQPRVLSFKKWFPVPDQPAMTDIFLLDNTHSKTDGDIEPNSS